MQDSIKELRQKHERQSKMMVENNNALQQEVERLGGELDRSIALNRNIEEEIVELKERKDSVQQWESQVAEIIQWWAGVLSNRSYTVLLLLVYVFSLLEWNINFLMCFM